ncbi:MAG: hypothetical protein AAFO70_03100 [Pseudomonadota bacterium]
MNWLDQQIGATADIMLGRGTAPGRGMARLDTSHAAFRTSFMAILLMVLIDATAHSLGYTARGDLDLNGDMGRVSYVVRSSLATLAAYAAMLFALVLVCRNPPYDARFNAVVIANNWANAIVSALFLPLAFGYALIGGDNGFWLLVVASTLAIVAVAATRILRDTLEISLGAAMGLFAATFLLSIFVSNGVEGVLGVG